MRIHTVQTAFIGGAIDESARSRSDIGLYKAAAAEALNCLPLATGGMLTRWGSKHCATLAGFGVAVEFAFSLAQAYVAVFGAGRVDFFTSDTGAAAGSLTANCPWTEAMLRRLRFAQAGDVMWIFHPDMPTQVIRRTGAAAWIIEPLTYDSVEGRPFYRYADQAIEATATAQGLGFSADWLVAGHVGTAIRFYEETAKVWRHGVIASVVDAKTATITWEASQKPQDGQKSRLWSEEAFSAVRGYARTGTIFQQRLWIGGSRDAGDALWASRVGLYWDFALGTATDTDGIQISLATENVRTIRQTIPGPQLTFLTEAGPHFIYQGDSKPITPTACRVKRAGSVGASDAMGGAFDDGVLMVEASGHAVRDLVWDDGLDNLAATPVSLAATDLLDGVLDAAYASASPDRPEQYAFFVTASGRMAVFHSLRAEKVNAWVRWETAGTWVSVAYAGRVLFGVTLRDGSYRLERFDRNLAFDASIPDTEPFMTPHLLNREIHGRNGDDYYGSGVSNATGDVVLNRRVQDGSADPLTAELGLAFDWRIVPLPPVVDMPNGTSVNQSKRVVQTQLKLYRARAAKLGGNTLTLLNDGFDPSVVPAATSKWWKTSHLGVAQSDDHPSLARPIERDVPMPTGVLAMTREVSV